MSPLEEIKSRVDAAELIRSYIRLEKAGINFKAICPFHSEKTPSFFVSPSRQIWHCFGGCGEGGDIFKFIMKIEGLDFPEALKLLAARAGVALKREDPSLRSERNRLYDLCEEAAAFFERNLESAPAVRSYLAKRGVKEETLKNFRIGFAPQGWDFLLKALVAKGFRPQEIERAGLVINRGQTRTEINADKRGNDLRESAIQNSPRQSALGWYDRFRGRIMFPIADSSGRVVGFSGRIFDAADSRGLDDKRGQTPHQNKFGAGQARTEAKYVNTSNTLIYDKSRILYGFDKAKQEIRVKNQAVLVEGQMDCVMSHQAGVKNAVAVSGTALTPQHLTALKRLCDTLITSFDIDAAGDSATRRSLELAARFEFKRKIAAISSGKDPAEAVLEDPAEWRKAVEEAKDIAAFYFEKGFRDYDPASAEGKKAIAGLVLPYLAELTDEIEKAHWVGRMATDLGVREEAVWKDLERLGAKRGTIRTGGEDFLKEEKPLSGRREILEERFLALFALMSEEGRMRAAAGREFVFISSASHGIFRALAQGAALAPEFEPQLEALRFKGEVLGAITKDLETECALLARELEKECLKERLGRLEDEIKRREKSGEQAAVLTLLKDFQSVSGKLKTILQER